MGDNGVPVVETWVYVTVINDKSAQEAHVNAAIMIEILKLFKESNPDVTEIWLRSDQAVGKMRKILFHLNDRAVSKYNILFRAAISPQNS